MYKYFSVLKKCIAVAVLGLMMAGCKHDNLLLPKPNENIRPAADFIKNNYDFRLFYAALDHTGLAADLNGTGPFTVLALPDNAFNGMGIFNEHTIRSLNKDSLRHAMQYHVLKNRRLRLADIPTNGVDVRYETLAGESVFVSAVTVNKEYFFDGARIGRSDIMLANGVLHVLNKVMQYNKGKTVQDHLAGQPQYSIFVAGLKKFGLWDELSQPGPFTIFAPFNQAFADHGITEATINALNPALYHGQRLFGAYVLYGKHFFVSDQAVFRAIGAEYNYKGSLRNDDWYINFGTEMLQANPGDIYFTPYPEFSLWKPNPLHPQLPERVGLVNQQRDSPRPLAEYDQRCENGIVHNLHGLVLLPIDAVK
jgi:uncharacterized surface protein with fasciclin (FAS1) repeats